MERQKIIQKEIEEEMKQSYVDYAMSVIVGRALPDVRDGLKPVHRRVLYSMWRAGLLHNKPFRKSAFIVGRTMSDLHPHGDAAIYDTLVRMAQDFSLRYPLINGHGNWGSIDGDSAAAMRYTECKLNKLAEEILQDLDKETVDFIPNFDNSLKEPTVLPSKIPNLLINGSSGIAVGMATNIPPHNLIEVVDGVIKLIENPDITIEEINKIIKGPDFPTGGFICGREGIRQAYKTGRGKVIVRAKANVEERKNKQAIIISEIPYQINKSGLLEQIAKLVQEKKIKGISNIRDESDREGMRVVIELKRDANSEIVLNQLYKHSRLQETFGIIMVALVNNEPKVLNLKQMVQLFIEHRQRVVRRRKEFELKKAQERDHILQGLIIALNDINNVIKKIKASKDVEEAKNVLIKGYKLTEIQAKAILDMRLQKLASLEQEKIRQEHKDLLKLIKELKEILASEKRILDIIKKELLEIKEKYGDERRTRIIGAQEDIEIEDLIKEEDDVITITHSGYIKRLPVDTYKKQRRGGKGVIGTGKKEQDFVEHLFIANTHSYILFFTDKGTVYWLKVYEIPEASRQSLGKAIVNLIEINKEEKITAFIPVREFDDRHYLLMATKKGVIKKTNLSKYSRPRSTGIKAIVLDPMDSLVNAVLTDGDRQIILATKKGMAVKFNEKDARPIGRTARGVRGISLRTGDDVIGMQIADDSKTLLTVTENGFGKRTRISEYRLINRGGVGVINIQCTDRNGDVVAVKTVSDDDELILISQNGIIIRVAVKGIPAIGRNTQGVRMMRLEKQDKVRDAAKIVKD